MKWQVRKRESRNEISHRENKFKGCRNKNTLNTTSAKQLVQRTGKYRQTNTVRKKDSLKCKK